MPLTYPLGQSGADLISNRIYYDDPVDQFIIKKLWSGVDPSGGESFDNLQITTVYNATVTGNQYAIVGFGQQNRQSIGFTSPSSGTCLNHSITTQVGDYNSTTGSSGVSEIGAHFLVLNPQHTYTNHDANYWLTDWNFYGPASGQERFMGAAFMIAKYNSGETLDATHAGAYGWTINSKPQGGGGADDGKSGLTSYRIRSAYNWAGWAGPSTATGGTHASATSGCQYVFSAGLAGGIWIGNGARSKYDTAFYATDFIGYGLEIDARHPDNTGNAIYVHNTAGGSGIYIQPDANIPLLVGHNTSTQITGRFSSTDAGATAGPIVELLRDSASPAVSDIIGQLRFIGKNSTPAQITYASIQTVLGNVTAGSEAGTLQYSVYNAGSSLSAFSDDGLDCLVKSNAVASQSRSIQVRGRASSADVIGKFLASSGAVVNIQAQSNHDLLFGANATECFRIVAASGLVQFKAATNFTANSTTATTMTSVGPAGANTTVQEWLTIKNAGGTTRYIPCY